MDLWAEIRSNLNFLHPPPLPLQFWSNRKWLSTGPPHSTRNPLSSYSCPPFSSPSTITPRSVWRQPSPTPIIRILISSFTFYPKILVTDTQSMLPEHQRCYLLPHPLLVMTRNSNGKCCVSLVSTRKEARWSFRFFSLFTVDDEEYVQQTNKQN